MVDEKSKKEVVRVIDTEVDTPATINEIAKIDAVTDIWKKDTLRNNLPDLCSPEENKSEPLLQRKKNGNSYDYDLTDYGRKKAKDWRELEKATEENKELNFGKSVQLFEEYFNETKYDKIAQSLKKGKNHISINLQELDIFNTELYDYLLREPETAIDAAEEALESIDIVSRDVELDVRFHNLPEEDRMLISETHSENIGDFIAVEGLVTHNSDDKPEVLSAIFECTQCGDRYRKEQESSQLKSPYQCDCGSRKFTPVKKIFTDSKVIKIREQSSKPNPRDITVRVEGELAKNKELEETSYGSIIRFNGVLKERPLKENSKKFDLYLEANSVEFKDKNSLNEISGKVQKKVEELSEDSDIKEKLRESIAAGAIGGLDRVKEAYLLYRLGKTDEGNIHLLVAGEEGVGKSKLAKESKELLSRTTYRVLKDTTRKGLTAAFTEDGEEGDIRAGDLVEADNGFFIGDEAGKFGEDYNAFNTPMSEEVVNRSARGTSVNLPASASVCLIMNPVKDDDLGRRWKEHPSIQELPIKNDTDTLSRFDLQVGIPKQKVNDGADSVRREIEKARKVNLDLDEIETPIEPEVYRAYLSLAEGVNPKISEEAVKILTRLYLELTIKDYATSPRVLEQWRRISKAYARMRFEEEVSEERVWEAFNFWKECRATLYEDYREEKNLVSESSGFEVNRVERLGEMLEILKENGKRMAKPDLKEEMGLGGSDTTRETVFGELLEAGLETEAITEEENKVELNSGFEFLQNQSISQLIDEELRKQI